MDEPIAIEVDGRRATVDDLRHLALTNYGHFTAAQVRGGGVRGLDRHRERMVAATRELYGVELDFDLVRRHIRHALGGVTEASVRAYVFRPEPGPADHGGGPVSVLVAVRAPVEPAATPLRLASVDYQRPLPHLKHVGSFGQRYHAERVSRAGYDDALLTAGGLVCETTIANVGVFDGDRVVWPDAPQLPGITMLLLEAALADAGPAPARRRLSVSDLTGGDGAFVCNSQGLTAVGSVDGVPLPDATDRVAALAARYRATPLTPL